MAYLLNGSPEDAKVVADVFSREKDKGEEMVHELCDHLFDLSKQTCTRYSSNELMN